MKKWYSSLSTYLKICLWMSVITVIGLIICIPLFFIGYKDIPLGILLGGFIACISYLLLNTQNSYKGKSTLALNVIFVFIKMLLICLGVALSVYLTYKVKIKLFNVVSVITTYLISTILLVIIVNKEDKHATSR